MRLVVISQNSLRYDVWSVDHRLPAMIRKPVCIGSWRSSWPLRPAEVEELRTGEWVPEPEAA